MEMRECADWSGGLEGRLKELRSDPMNTAASIAAALGLTISQVNNRLHKLKIKKPTGRAYTILNENLGCLELAIPGNGDTYTTWIDKDLFSWFCESKWCAHKDTTGGIYVVGGSGGRKKLHRAILAAPAGVLVDHRDRDGLNNRRSNLRLASPSQNSYNSGPRQRARSQYKNVWLHECGLYSGAVRAPDGRRYRYGYYKTEYAAARAHDALASMLRGEFAFLNVPNDPMTQEEISKQRTLSKVMARLAGASLLRAPAIEISQRLGEWK